MGARRMAIPCVERLGAVLIEDVGVPIPRIPELVATVEDIAARHRTSVPVIGHAGDGNFHLIIMLDPADRKEFDTITRISERLVERALKFGGTCSGEHGVGMGKLKYLNAEHGASLDVMRAIKRALDPENRMNPGKMFAL